MAQTEEILDAAVTGIPRVAKVIRDVPLFVEHCEAVATEIDVKLR
jgi:hypothetical protein